MKGHMAIPLADRVPEVMRQGCPAGIATDRWIGALMGSSRFYFAAMLPSAASPAVRVRTNSSQAARAKIAHFNPPGETIFLAGPSASTDERGSDLTNAWTHELAAIRDAVSHVRVVRRPCEGAPTEHEQSAALAQTLSRRSSVLTPMWLCGQTETVPPQPDRPRARAEPREPDGCRGVSISLQAGLSCSSSV